MVKAGDLWYLKGDMHIHSHFSDGERLEKMLARVIACGFDFCAISDHDTFAGSRAAMQMMEMSRSPVPVIIRSQESTCSGCHILSYGTLEEYVKSVSLEEVCRNIRAAGGYAVAAHPDWVHTRSMFRESGLFAHLVESGMLDGVELMNFPKLLPGEKVADEWTNRYYFERSKKGLPFAVTCGSDAHSAEEITPERYIAVFAESCDEKGILDAIFRYKRSVAVRGDCVIGTPEACELYFSMPQNPPCCKSVLHRKECVDGIQYTLTGADEIFVCGDLEKQSDNTFFKAGFDHADALVTCRNGSDFSAWYIGVPDRVEVKCVPVVEDGTIKAGFEINYQERVISKCRVNGDEFVFDTNSFACGTLRELDNDIEIVVYDSNSVVLCRKQWDFPVGVLNKWYVPELLISDAPSPDGVEPEARFMFSKSGDDLVINIEVVDKLFCQPCRGFGMYMGDSVQFGLDFDCAASENDLIDRKIWELGISVTDSGTCDFVIYNSPIASGSKPAEKLQYSAVRAGDKSIFRTVVGKDFSVRKNALGFNMIFNINDGSGRRGYLAWRKGIGDRKKSADWGYILLNESK